MKKILFLLLCTVSIHGQTYQNPTFGTVTTKTAPLNTTSDFITTTSSTGVQGKILGENISLSVIPPVHHFTPITTNIKGYFQGVDNALGDIVATTAGVTTRLWLTADQTTITAGTFYRTNFTNKGVIASAIQSVTNNDNEKKYFTQDIIGDAYVAITTFPKGVYAGNLSVSTSPNSAQQRFTVEVYKCNNAGTPIASGISGAVTGSLGVTVITILDSGLLTLADESVTNVPVSNTIEFPFTINVGERVRYHISAEKVGATGANITESLYLGTSYNSYIDVPVPLNTSAVQNLSNVVGATTTDALNNLLNLTEVTPNQFTGTDAQKIQLALNFAVANNKTLRINKNQATGFDLWDIDSAILLKSNSKIIIDNVTLKLTNTSRDNIFRTENCGFGLTTPSSNPLVNISIIGLGNAILQGADNPRATGDTGKTLSLTPAELTDTSYGTDAGVGGQTQTGDWRNIGVLMAYTTGIKIQGLKYVNMHAWANSFERCTSITIKDLYFNSVMTRTISASTKYIKNLDGVDFRLGCSDIFVDNISGTTSDDTVAVTLVPVANKTAGIYGAMEVTGNYNLGVTDNAKDIQISNIKTNTDHGIIRLLNVLSTTIKNVQISNIEDLSTTAPITGSCVIMGSTNPVYGGVTPIGDLAFVNINNVISRSKPYAIRVDGSISESSISNIVKESVTNDPISFHASSLGSRDLSISNVIHKGIVAYESGILNGTVPVFYGTKKVFSSSYNFVTGFESENIVSAETNIDNYTLLGNYVTPSSGLTNIPSGWAQKRYTLFTAGSSSTPYKEQTLTDGFLNVRAFRSSSVAGVWGAWRVLATLDVVTGVSYTPTLANTSNVTGATLESAVYTRVGDIVTVRIGLTANVTTGGTGISITASLPIARSATTALLVGNLSGYLTSAVVYYGGVFQLAVANTTDVRILCVPITSGANSFVGTFSYKVN